MANYSYTSNDINFTINDDAWVSFGVSAGNDNNWANIQNGRQKSVKPFVNAVEIDWNGAIIGES